MTNDLQEPPNAMMAEKAILSSMLNEPDQFIPRALGEGITEASFYTPGARTFFDAVVKDFRAHADLDILAFTQRRITEGTLDTIGGAGEIADVLGYTPGGSGAWSQWLAQVKEAEAHRAARSALVKIAGAEDSTAAIRELEKALEATRRAAEGPRRSITAKQASREFLARLEADQQAGGFPGAETGLHSLDTISGGMRPGELWVVAARPSRGKTVLQVQLAAEFVGRGDKVAFFSLEMMAHEVVGRLVSVMGRVDFSAITQPRTATSADFTRIRTTLEKLAETRSLWIDASASQSLETIRGEAQRLADAHGGLDLVCVDYLQLVRGNRARNESREEEIARVSGGLKQLAKELRCPVLTASQLNDAGQTRESRAIEQDADALLYIADDGIKIGKLRNGPRNEVLPLYLNGAMQRFTGSKP